MIEKYTTLDLEEFIAMVEKSHRISFKNYPSIDTAFMHVTSTANTLFSLKYGYPNLYHIQGIEGKEYVVMYNESDPEKTDIIEIEIGLEAGDHEDSVCKQIIANDGGSWWGIEAFGYYNMFGHIPLSQKNDRDVAIWVEKIWEDGYRDRPDNDYLKADDGYNMIFETYSEAEYHLSMLIEKEYVLAPYEVNRPVYTITE
ncbi:MAG: hypothetical protein J6N72_02280 [Psychrobacter sp.]|nr:hypothetical protein [Psychrobacter sp.]